MIKEWATVVSWQNGIAVVRCEQSSGCGSCKSRSTCGTGLLNQLGASADHLLTVSCGQPLEIGQRIELGIAEASLLRSAVVVYFLPLLGLLFGASLFQMFFASDLSAMFGAFVGGGMAFVSVKLWAKRLGKNNRYEPLILQIALPGELLQINPVSQS
ncbi:RseC/MucC-like positive regulator of sigma(E)|uniref:RseC/MucC-like positive regulator of sigma(E) n=1 Tax=Brenneria salicis ATCC 15712 = DSM 30166 TaxID=714314 RepID=A0A366I7R3_9GAMM|nr:SoxR-reducing system protein RseC [Brenneria salicis]NMN90838.1 RseC/MucC-like positive regulator of sigma(E) [Brenneria salicis ATCC 15712 = DSM 30166]RBP63562.1 RseC/MucC-like positive regulator of sigma(E) [Brenneria salicis ATCC 15712 = DSM 30166]RLM30981.1 SoxR reducing system protein RseC [Brenneria salicis ATCC 15712 = DSM 30166]